MSAARVAYIVSAYHRPEMLIRLVERLDSPDSRFLIHVDARTHVDLYRAMTDVLASRSNVVFLPRHSCHWGDFGHVRATLKGIREIVSSAEPVDYTVLLTGQDYPLRSNQVIATTLANAEDKVFMRPIPIPSPEWTNGGTYRYTNRHFRMAGRPFAFPGAPFRNDRLRRIWHQLARLCRFYRTFPAGLEPWGGSSYWMIPIDCARYIHGYAQAHPDVVRFFQSVRIPDEIFFHTLVMNSPYRQSVVGDDLRYIDWSEGADSPKTLTLEDLPRLLESEALFARKFDPSVDVEVLDRLDALSLNSPKVPDVIPPSRRP